MQGPLWQWQSNGQKIRWPRGYESWKKMSF